MFDALANGALSFESDVWLNPKDEKLYVGHDPFSLSKERTFHNLTVMPLVKAIEQANIANANYTNNEQTDLFGELQASVATNKSNWWNGYYSLGVGSGQPIQLLVDVKNNANASWPKIVAALEPLRQRGFLTRYDHGKIIKGPVIVVGTGSTPPEQLAAKTQRDVFLDCEMTKLTSPGPVVDGKPYDWNSTLCPIASTDFVPAALNYTGIMAPSDKVNASLKGLIDEAHKRGILTRFWDTPAWPIYARDRVNRLLLELGSDWINADDLEGVAHHF